MESYKTGEGTQPQAKTERNNRKKTEKTMETFGMFALGAILGAVTGFVAAVRMVATIRRKRDRAEVGYVARDKDGELWLYPEKPYKTDDDCWTTRSFVSMRVYPERFATVNWDDEEPTKVCLIESSELV